MPPKKRKKHIASLVEIKKKKPNVKTKNEDHRTVLFIDLENLGSLISIFNCPGCKQSDCLSIWFTTNELLNFYLKIKCTLCSFSAGHWALEKNFNSVFVAAKTCSGVTNMQIQRMLAMIGMSGQTEAGNDRLPDFTSGSNTAARLQKTIDEMVIQTATDSMLYYRESFVSERRKAHPRSIEVAIDGTYNDTGL